MSLQKIKKQWETLGRLDPLWAMTGTNKFGTWDIDEFLSTGDRQIDHLMTYIGKFGYPHERTCALDYGCGVGRKARGFRNHFNTYLGLDIAESLISKAREIHKTTPDTNFRVVTESPLTSFADNSFDLIYCWSVLHHLPNDHIQQLLNSFVRLVKPHGLLVFTVIHEMWIIYHIQLRRRLFALLSRIGVSETTLYKRLHLYPQQVHTISRDQAVAYLNGTGANILEISPDEARKHAHQYWTYYVTK